MNPLLADLSDYYVSVYGSSDVTADELTGLRDRLLTVTCRGEDAGIVGVREVDTDTAEAVRLWVAPPHRCHNHGRQLVERAVAAARGLGYERLVTMTSTEHPDALQLLAQLGWPSTASYGPYADDPRTRCFARLTETS